MKKSALSLVALLLFLYSFAQTTETAAEATGLRAEGKVYVVMAVVITILAGLFVYLIGLDRKISRMEKKSD